MVLVSLMISDESLVAMVMNLYLYERASYCTTPLNILQWVIRKRFQQIEHLRIKLPEFCVLRRRILTQQKQRYNTTQN